MTDNKDFFHHLSCKINKIDRYNSYESGDFFIDSLNKLEQVINSGFISIDAISSIVSKTQLITQIANKKQNEIHNSSYPSICAISQSLDQLMFHLDEPTFGAIALINKDHHQMIKEKFGPDKLEIFIAEHYIRNPIYSKMYAQIRTKSGTFELSLDIIAKKKLSKIIGPKLYFDSHAELFFKSDLAHVAELYRAGICTGLICPRTICIFCREIKSAKNTHDKCYNKYHEKNFCLVDESKHKKKSDTIALDNDNLIGIDTKKSILITQCCCNRCSRKKFDCQYLYPELVILATINYSKYFSLETKFDMHLDGCDGRCECKYSRINEFGIIKKSEQISRHKNNWNTYKKIVELKKQKVNPIRMDHTCGTKESKTKSCMMCNIDSVCNNYVVPIKSICKNITIYTPCWTCSRPKFLHGFK